MTEEQEKKVYSKHLFVLPFLLKPKKEPLSVKSKDWSLVKRREDLPYLKIFEESDGKNPTAYAHQCYFNKEAQELIFCSNKEEKLVENYTYYISNDENEKKYYRISYFGGNNSLKYFDLKVDYIFLRHLPKLGIAYLVFGLTNNKYDRIKDIKLINQYGRRIYNPFLSIEKQYLEAPNNIEILSADQINEKPSVQKENTEEYKIMEAPRELLKDCFSLPEKAIFPQELCEDDHLELIIDDRMFVHSYIGVEELRGMIQSTNDSEILYDGNIENLKNLYAWAFIDKDDATCDSRDMLKEILSDSLYTRWSERNSLYMVTQHSFLYLTNGGEPPFLQQYFLTEYLDLLLIVLSQRTASLKYSHDAGSKVKSSVKEILTLQEDYVTFKNQFLLPEVSAQEQAIDVYHLLQKNLYIEKYVDILDNQISSLHAISQTKSDNKMNYIIFCLTTLTVLPNFSFLDKHIKEIKLLSFCPSLGELKLRDFVTVLVLFGFFIYYCCQKSKK